MKPDYAEAHNRRGLALRKQGKWGEASHHLREAIKLRPDYAEAYYNLGATLCEVGRLKEARSAYEKAVELGPRNPAFYLALANVKRFSPGDHHLTAMETLEAELTSFSSKERISLHFALGKAYDDLEKHNESFRHLLKGNALKRQLTPYNEPAAHDLLSRVQAVFTAELIRGKRDHGNPSRSPVFVLGMPRSGTTLVEQILASHPKVFGAGELIAIAGAVANLGEPAPGTARYLEVVSFMSGDELYRFGSNYVSAIRNLAPKAERITDKMPMNFIFIGLIYLVLSNTRIIHVKRDPIDTCYSCYANLFAAGQEYSYDLAELGRFYRAYDRLMEHWRTVLPPGVMLAVQYEDVVGDLKSEARRIVAHCGLQWDDSCLAFHGATRPVRTASAAQVRLPIYRTSIGRSLPYKQWLSPLVKELNSLNENRDLPQPRRAR